MKRMCENCNHMLEYFVSSFCGFMLISRMDEQLRMLVNSERKRLHLLHPLP